MGSRGSDYERRRREEEPWWAQQDADKVAEEQRRLRDEAREQTGRNIDVIKGPRGEYYFADLNSGDMWTINQSSRTEQQSKFNPEFMTFLCRFQ